MQRVGFFLFSRIIRRNEESRQVANKQPDKIQKYSHSYYSKMLVILQLHNYTP